MLAIKTDEVPVNSNQALEADVAAIRADLNRLRADTEQIHAKTTEMWLTVVERKAILKVLQHLFGGALVGALIAFVLIAIVQASRA